MTVLSTGERYDGDRRIRMRIDIHEQLDPSGIALFISQRTDHVPGALNMVWREGDDKAPRADWNYVDDGEYRAPFILIDRENAQRLMEQLWRAGVRTKDSLESGAHRTALEGHLADMRQLVTRFADVDLSGTKPNKAP